MYTIEKLEKQDLHYLELTSSDGASKAQISLNQGGRLSHLVFEGIQVLADFDASTYENNYASSIQFPFVNRIKDGKYTFNNSKYKLNCNEVDKNNALHGLVYNKTFVCTKKTLTLNYASVTLQYKDYGKHQGFPFKFNIDLTYTLNKKGIIVSVNIANKDKKTFPFSLGWHPYFYSKNLYNSTLSFISDKKYVFDNQQIISGKTDLNIEMPFQLKAEILDNCYPLKTNEIDLLYLFLIVFFATGPRRIIYFCSEARFFSPQHEFFCENVLLFVLLEKTRFLVKDEFKKRSIWRFQRFDSVR